MIKNAKIYNNESVAEQDWKDNRTVEADRLLEKLGKNARSARELVKARTMTNTMTHDEIENTRVTLELSVADMARMLGHDPVQQRRLESAPDVKMHRQARPTTVRLLRAYLDGYRPDDWPEHSKPGLAAKQLKQEMSNG